MTDDESVGLTLWEEGHPSLFVRCSALLHHALSLAVTWKSRLASSPVGSGLPPMTVFSTTVRDRTVLQLQHTVDDWKSICLGLHVVIQDDQPCSTVVPDEQWFRQMQMDLKTVMEGLEPILSREEQSAADLQRRGLRYLHQQGFPLPVREEEPRVPFTIAAPIGTAVGSYHTRSSPFDHTGLAPLSLISIQAQLQADELDTRYGDQVSVPIPHPHPEVNTQVMIAEPKKKKALMDEYRIIPHPRKAAVHAVEDLLTDEEHLYRDCVILKEHLLRCGSLEGLPTHLHALLWELLEGEVMDVDALLAEDRGRSERSLPAAAKEKYPPMLMDVAQRLKEKMDRLSDVVLRQTCRETVSTVGHYAQSVLWRDQVLNAFKNNGASWGSLSELESLCPCVPIVVENPFATEDGGQWEEDALRLVLEKDIDAFQGVFRWCLPILRGTWGEQQQESRAKYYVLPLFVAYCLQSVLALVTTLQSARFATRCPPMNLLKDLISIPEEKTNEAVLLLLEKEGTENLEVAKLMSIVPCRELLAYRLRFVESEGYLELTQAAMTSQRIRQDAWKQTVCCTARNLFVQDISSVQRVDLAKRLLETTSSTVVVVLSMSSDAVSSFSNLPPPIEFSSSYAALSMDDAQLPLPRPLPWTEHTVQKGTVRELGLSATNKRRRENAETCIE